MRYPNFHSAKLMTDPLSYRTKEHCRHFHMLKNRLTYQKFCSAAMRLPSIEVFKSMSWNYLGICHTYQALPLSNWALDYWSYLVKL